MDAVGDDRRIIRRLIDGYAEVRPAIGDVQVEAIFEPRHTSFATA